MYVVTEVTASSYMEAILVLLSLWFLEWIFPRMPQNFEFLNMLNFLSSLMPHSHSITPVALLKIQSDYLFLNKRQWLPLYELSMTFF